MSSPHPRRRATAADVAERAGVAPSTVSKAISGRGSLKQETRDRVIAAARELDFRVNLIAASIRSGRTLTVGAIVDDHEGRISIKVLVAAAEVLSESGIAVIFQDGRGDPVRERHFLEGLLERRVDGLLLIGNSSNRRPHLALADDVPAVYVFAPSSDPDDYSVVADDYGAARLATKHLLATGRTRLAFVSGNASDQVTGDRLRGVTDELRTRGLELAADPEIGAWTEAWGRASAARLIANGAGVDGIVCASDQIARGVMDALAPAGVDVPRDIGVVGIDNRADIVESMAVTLTSVDLDLELVGATAAKNLLRLIDRDPPAERSVTVESRLVPRLSTA